MEEEHDSQGEWHRLFDALCIEGGHLDNRLLASQYCDVTRNKTVTAYEAALKSLSNWRSGQHRPSRRNFRILTALLDVENHDALAQWNRLYEAGLRRKATAEIERSEPDIQLAPLPRQVPDAPLKRHWMVAAAAGFVVLGAAGALLGTALCR